MLNVWIFNHYATDTYFNENERHYSYAKYLIKQGYKVVIFCANTMHGKDKIVEVEDKYKCEVKNGIEYVFVKCPSYGSNGVKRILNMYIYYNRLKKIYKNFDAPDIIIGSQVHPLACLAAIQISKKIGCKCITEYRDLWPVSIVEYSRLTNRNVIIKALYKLEKYLYLKSDGIIFTMPGGIDYLKEQSYSSRVNYNYVYDLNNGVDLDVFEYNRNNFIIKDADLISSKFKIMYTGSMRLVNGIESILDVLSKLNFDFICVLYGFSEDVENLKKEIEKRDLVSNVFYKGEIKKNQVPYALSHSDLNIIYWKSKEITKRGISANKIFDYFAAAKPIISNNTRKYDFIEENKIGYSHSIESIDDYARCITNIYEASIKERENMGMNAMCLAKEYDYKNLAIKFDRIIKEVMRRN